ncbi:MAG: chorismate-binding protein, partial [Phycisphaerales bacterium]
MFCSLTKERFIEEARRGLAVRSGRGDSSVAIPLGVRLLSDQLTPVLAYRRLVVQDQRSAPSFLFESVEGGERQGRHSILGAHPVIEVVAREHKVRTSDKRGQSWNTREFEDRDPLLVPSRLTAGLSLHVPERRIGGAGDGPLPKCFLGGWAGFAGYDTVRYAEPEKLPFSSAPADDRKLPDMHFGFYDEVVIFDHVDKVAHVVRLVEATHAASDAALGEAYDNAVTALERTLAALQTHSKPLPAGVLDVGSRGAPGESNMTRERHGAMLDKAREYIKAGDIFQVVLGQRFERRSKADPFDVYRALRAVNPSPYMAYMQCEGCILVASSPEILCRVRRSPSPGAGAGGGFASVPHSRPRSIVTNRPLAGTRRRGGTPEE